MITDEERQLIYATMGVIAAIFFLTLAIAEFIKYWRDKH